METFLHPYPIFSILSNLNFLPSETPKFKLDKFLPHTLSQTQNTPKDPKLILILTIKLLYTYFWKTLPAGDWFGLHRFGLLFPKAPKSRNPPQITWKEEIFAANFQTWQGGHKLFSWEVNDHFPIVSILVPPENCFNNQRKYSSVNYSPADHQVFEETVVPRCIVGHVTPPQDQQGYTVSRHRCDSWSVQEGEMGQVSRGGGGRSPVPSYLVSNSPIVRTTAVTST